MTEKQTTTQDNSSAEIGPHDILLGRGGATNNHEGNRKFRMIVAEHQNEYLQARKRDKVIIARRVVSIVQSNGGRFLKRDASNSWVPVSDKRAQEKTSQALREGLDVRNNTIRPSKMIKEVRETMERQPEKKTKQPVTLKSPTSSVSHHYYVSYSGSSNNNKTPLYMPELKEEEQQQQQQRRTEPVFLLYQPLPLASRSPKDNGQQPQVPPYQV